MSNAKMFDHYPEAAFANLYSERNTMNQLRKFLFRRGNHWAKRIEIVFDLVNKLNIQPGRVLDLGTNIGTYAIEFAERGHQVSALDLDPRAIHVAKMLSDKQGLKIDFRVGDVADRSCYNEGSFDLIYAGDIIEHLPQPVLDACLQNCQYWLKDGGFFIYHTVPLKYDVVFHQTLAWCFLIPFSVLPDPLFKKCVHAIYSVMNRICQWVYKKSYSDYEKETPHCNLHTKESMTASIKSAKFDNIYTKLCTTEPQFRSAYKDFFFLNKEYYYKDLFGVAWKPYVEIQS